MLLFRVGCCVIFLIVFHFYVVAFVVSWFFWYEGRAWGLGVPGVLRLHRCECVRLRRAVTFLRGASISGGVCEIDNRGKRISVHAGGVLSVWGWRALFRVYSLLVCVRGSSLPRLLPTRAKSTHARRGMVFCRFGWCYGLGVCGMGCVGLWMRAGRLLR